MRQIDSIGIKGIGIYLPDNVMYAQDIARATKGHWSKEAIEDKLGIKRIFLPGVDDGTQEMGVRAAWAAIYDGDIDPKDIDVILCFGEEWKEYPLTTSALYIQDKVGATNAWGIDLQNRCCTTVSALKIAKDMLISDESIHTILLAGGYRNGDFVDFENPDMSMLYNLSAGAGAVILQKGYEKNEILGTHIISDGSFSRLVGLEIGGIVNPINANNAKEYQKSLRFFNPIIVKDKLREVSLENWMICIEKALNKSGKCIEDISFINVVHMKRSSHLQLLDMLGLQSSQSLYLEDYGHMGQVDQILSLKLARDRNLIQKGDIILSIAAGIGYVWAANVIKWG